MITVTAVKIEEMGYITTLLDEYREPNLDKALSDVKFAVEKNGANQIEITITRRGNKSG